MKKLFRISSLVLTFLLIVTSLTSVSVFAASTDPRLTVGNGTEYDIDIGVSDAAELNIMETRIVKATAGGAVVTSQLESVNKDNIIVYKLPIPNFSAGKQLDKYILRFANNNATPSGGWNAKKIPGTDISNLTAATITPNANAYDIAYTNRYSKTFGSYPVNIGTIDISSYAKECYNAGQEFFYIAVYSNGTNKIWNLSNTTVNAADSGFNGDDVKPYVYYTEADAGEFTFSSVVNPASSNDCVKFTFSNPVVASSVTLEDFTVTDLSGETVEVSEDEINVSGATVSLNKAWDAYGYYTVEFNGEISDIYGQKLNVQNSTQFEISGDSETLTIATKPLVRVCDGTNANCGHSQGYFETQGSEQKVLTQKHYVLFQVDLSDIDADSLIADAKFNYYATANTSLSKDKLRIVPDYEWTTDAGLDTDYYNSMKEAYNNSANKIESTTNIVADSNYDLVTADVADIISGILADGNAPKKVTFAVYNAYTNYVLGHGSSYKKDWEPELIVNLVNKSFDAVTTFPAKCGKMNGVSENIELTLATVIDDSFANDTYIQLQDMAGNKIDATVSVNGSKVTIDPVADLAAYTEYKVVLKNGIEDAYENIIDDGDKVIHRFTSGSALVFDEIKFTDDVSPIYDAVNVITGYNAGDEVTAVTKFENTSGIDLPVLMIIALYGSDDSLIKIDAVGGPFDAQANQTIQFSKTIEVPSDAVDTYIKAFAWNNLENMRPVCVPGIIEQN